MAKRTTLKSKVIQYVRENGPQRFTDLQRFIYDHNHGEGSYDKGKRLERTWNYKTKKYEEKMMNTNRGYHCCSFYGTRAYFLYGGTEQLYKNKDGLYDVANETNYDNRKWVGRRPNPYYQGETNEFKMSGNAFSEIELPRTEDGVIFAVTGESKNAKETLEELMERTKNPKKFNVQRVDINHVKVTLDGGSSFFFPNRQWDLLRKYVLNSHYGSMDQARVRYYEMFGATHFKAKPGDLLFYIDENKVCSADLLEIKFRWTKDQKKVTTYTTIHGTYSEDRVFTSKEELIKSL